MKAQGRSIIHLFDGKRRYLVPLFQRQYVWNQTNQWEPLWEDINRMIERRETNGKGSPHFLGALVLDQARTYGNQVPSHVIIDGQQRMTTFQIVLSALRDIARVLNVIRYADELQRYIINTGIMEIPDEECFKVWPTRVDQGAFKAIMLSDFSATISSNLLSAYRFFYQTIKKYIDGSQDEDTERKIERLFQVLRDDLEIVSIELEGDDDPQVIFETLNARGEPLLPSDLMRNFIAMTWRDSQTDSASTDKSDCRLISCRDGLITQ